jgi:hypothetical protein
LNSSPEDRELENLSAQIVDGELQVALDDADVAAASEASLEDGEVKNANDDVANDLGQAVARLAVDDEIEEGDDENEEEDEGIPWMMRRRR